MVESLLLLIVVSAAFFKLKLINFLFFIGGASISYLLWVFYLQSQKNSSTGYFFRKKCFEKVEKQVHSGEILLLKGQTQILENIAALQEEIIDLRAQIKKGIDNQE